MRRHNTEGAAKGLWIALEGGEGSGKSTQLKRLTERYGTTHTDSAGHRRPVVFTREPGGTTIGQTLRQLLLHGTEPVPDRCEALLMAADRAAHWAQVVEPALQQGALVIADRSVWSSVVYQGHARGLCRDDVAALSDFATYGRWPDLAVVLDVDLATSRNRRTARTADRIEQEGQTFQQRIRDGYLAEAQQAQGRLVIVDATADADDVHEAIVAAIEEILQAGLRTGDGPAVQSDGRWNAHCRADGRLSGPSKE